MNLKWMVSLFLICLFCCGPALTLEPTPPESLVDKGACPFECCKYRTWYVEKRVDLREKPELNSKIVAALEPGSAVEAVTGEVHVTAGIFSVQKAFSRYEPGDRFWVYTYLGEGWFKTWYEGRYYEEDLGCSPNEISECSSNLGGFEKEPVSVWWVLIKTENGKIGWTNSPDSFSNKDACS
jgi:hypothetical protein